MDETEIPVRISVETCNIFVSAAGYPQIVIKIFVVVRFPIAVLIMQSRDLITPRHIHFVSDYLQAKWLEQPRRKTPPVNLSQLSIDTTDDPYIAMNCADSRIAVGKKS